MRRQYFSITAAREIFKCFASRPISSSEIHTYPGPPVQQFPHCEQVNVSPSAYQGFSSVWTTFSFIAMNSTELSRLDVIYFAGGSGNSNSRKFSFTWCCGATSPPGP